MKEKEFNLSDYIISGLNISGDLPVFRVKKAVKILKEKMNNVPCYCKDKNYTCTKCKSDNKINEIFGDKLI